MGGFFGGGGACGVICVKIALTRNMLRRGFLVKLVFLFLSLVCGLGPFFDFIKRCLMLFQTFYIRQVGGHCDWIHLKPEKNELWDIGEDRENFSYLKVGGLCA